jgi:hypothetical protein
MGGTSPLGARGEVKNGPQEPILKAKRHSGTFGGPQKKKTTKMFFYNKNNFCEKSFTLAVRSPADRVVDSPKSAEKIVTRQIRKVFD